MRMLMVALAATLLAGLRGFGDGRRPHANPLQDFEFGQTRKVVAQCVQFAWQDEAVFGVDAAAYLQPARRAVRRSTRARRSRLST